MAIKMGNIIRPRVDEDWIIKTRVTYPMETAEIQTIEGIVEFAFKKALEKKEASE
jgi:hypothetical protein